MRQFSKIKKITSVIIGSALACWVVISASANEAKLPGPTRSINKKVVDIKQIQEMLQKRLDERKKSRNDASIAEAVKQLTNQNKKPVVKKIKTHTIAPKGKTKHHAKTMSLNFSNIKTRQLLQILAQFSGKNFVITDSVNGSMSIHLKDVSWHEALTVVLKSQGLGKHDVGNNVILVAPISELAKLDIQRQETQRQVQGAQPPVDEVIKIKYEKAAVIANLIQSNGQLLSKGGSISPNERTNSVWIHDIPTQIKPIVSLINKLDKPSKQVVIEARIVSVDKNFERQLGAKIGFTNTTRNMSGTLSGANSIASGTAPSSVTITDRLNFSVPSTVAGTGSVAYAALKIFGNTYLDAALSAGESKQHVEILSSPKLITSNQKPAYIRQGEEIPYGEATSSGAAAVSFKKAELTLEVTPQIIPPNRIMLQVKVTNNRRGNSSIEGSGGAQNFPITTEEEESHVLLNDNQTVILGGVYKKDKRNNVERVPFLGQIPILGTFFSHKTKVNNTDELLIFLTPHIINSPEDI